MKRKTETVATTEIASAEIVDAAVGARIRALRRSKGLGLNEMSARTGLSIGFLSQMERGLSSPTLRALTSLADAMPVSYTHLDVYKRQGYWPHFARILSIVPFF